MTGAIPSEPSTLVAIIGIGCRLPGADDPRGFFRNLLAGHDAVRRGPAAGTAITAFGRLDAVEAFDAEFFDLIPRHAALLAPEQRLLLECAWWAMEEAGLVPNAVPGSVGVFVAAAKSSYDPGPPRHESERLVVDSAIGQDYAATRISYKLNLRGPSLSVQTASSGSLVAVHLACEALLSGQCDMALAGGASVTLPQDGYRYDESLILAADGHCRPFDAAASGTVPGNGAAMVLLKPLDAALRDGDPVVAVIRAGAVNNDGAGKVDYYAPSQDGQSAVIREALAMAGLTPAEIGYVEAHGTGTPLGDPIEIAALQEVFGEAGVAPGSVALGALKGSIGHLHTAAGVAGLVKTALMLRHRTLVPSLHYRSPNPHSVLAGSAFTVCTRAQPWPAPAGGGPRRAGISAFGIGGTNAHLVLEEPPPVAARPPERPGTWHLVPLSARSPAALAAQSRQLAAWLDGEPGAELRDIALTLRVGRRHDRHRRAVLADSLAGLRAALDDAPRGGAPAALAEAATAFEAGGDLLLPLPAEARRIALPGTAFARRRHWIAQPDPVPDARPRALAALAREIPADDAAAPELLVHEVPAREAAGVQASASDAALLPRLRRVLAEALGRDEAEIADEAGFAELGIESIVAPLLAAELSAETGLPVSAQDFYNHPTPARLAASLDGRAALPPAPDKTPPDAPGPASPAPAEEPLAIVGMAGRFPGAPTLDAFWRLIAAGERAVAPLPPGLWTGSEAAVGGLMPDYDAFDAAFFQVSPREARLMDPQQRVFLESCWHALDDAGLVAAGLAGRNIGVFAGAQASDYPQEDEASHATIGQSMAILAARVAYALDLRGPALTVDTACSSALAALHLAAQSLRLRDCDVALAGGVSIALPYRRGHAFFSDAGLLSPGGACRPFAPDADGIVVADGVGVVVLKRLSDARRDGDTVRGVVRASALNQDGRTNGITAPSGPAQAALIGGLYRRAGIDPASIAMVEAHGTGTRLGDPIELAALSEVFGAEGCALGSVKANIGHALPAAGMAGLLKLLLAMEAGLLPPQPGPVGQAGDEAEEAPGGCRPLPGSRFHVLTRPVPWPAGRRRAAVSAFGFGGTNAHVVIEQAGIAAPDAPAGGARPSAPGRDGWPILLSAPDGAALARLAASLRDWLDAAGAVDLGDLASTLAGRARFQHRAGFVALDRSSLRAGLAALAEGRKAGPGDAVSSAFLRGDAPVLPPGRRLRLPPYPFARDRFWIAPPSSPATPAAEAPPRPVAASPGSPDALDCLRQMVADALMLDRQDVAADAGFAALGLDSILAAELASRVNARLGTSLRALDFYDHPTPAALLAAIEAGAPSSAPSSAPAAPARAVPDGLIAALRAAVAEALYVAPEVVTETVPLTTLGLDSILAVELARTLTERLALPVLAIDFYDAATVASLAALLAGRAPEPAQDLVVKDPVAPKAVPTATVRTDAPPEPAPPPAAAPAREEDHHRDAIAIIGLAGRFPGAPDLDAFWDGLREGRDAVGEIPASRWSLEGFFDPCRDRPGRSYSRWGGFLDGIDRFDPLFFRISPREAELIDPQERLFLTCAQAALEDAGWRPAELGAGQVGVFAGLMYGEWQLLAAEASGPGQFVPAHAPYWSVANRVSYTFGWRGPSMAVDSACSSSLTALHLACASLRRGECAAALAGGVNLSLHPRKYLGLSAGRFAASDGRCRSFGAGGDGYVPGEGVGVAVLKRLGDALRDGDPIHAVIRGSAVNHGGASSGYAVPSPEGQAGVIRAALAEAGVAPASIGYVEAHGTGTALGDPIELA
ncbi:beta-ketoacyl synthase N-terminal-like domain-containing protein, partial [Methylobacterium aquaticum]|uniref:beta-ketoacyl synthase N-terminal-like domain-containing protein n=1 Tax=Methylobacterium aquaticum TaxID=270351 RepID=UPI000A58E1DD